jgi:ABC-type multidrug transport system permease subunit
MDDAFERLSSGDTRAVVVLREGVASLETIDITIDVTDSIIQQIVYSELPQIIEAYTRQYAIEFLTDDGVSSQQASRIVQFFGVDITTNEWKDIEYFDFGASGVIVIFLMGICLLMSVTAITSERTSGTIERIFASPYKGSEFIISKMLAYTLVAIIVTALIIVTLKFMFNIVLGNILLVFLISILIGINAVILGLLVSAVTYTELESVLGGIVFWFLGLILMGFTWPFETMHPFFTYVSKLTPYSYGLHALRHVNLTNWSLDQIWFDLVVLLAFIVVQALLAIQFLRREIG